MEETWTEEFRAELAELVAAARRMTQGQFHHLVHSQARGRLGDLALHINQTLENFQALDPIMRRASREASQVAGGLTDVIRTTEGAAERVLEQAEHLMEEQGRVEAGLQALAGDTQQLLSPAEAAECGVLLEEVRGVHRQAQGRGLEIMAAMEFQDLTAQKIRRLIALISDIEMRLCQVLALFRLDEADAEGALGPPGPAGGADASELVDQELVDKLLGELKVAAP